jgi:hypothetical protein
MLRLSVEFIDVSEERIASVFKPNSNPNNQQKGSVTSQKILLCAFAAVRTSDPAMLRVIFTLENIANLI